MYCERCGGKTQAAHEHTTGGGIIDRFCTTPNCRRALLSYAPLTMDGAPDHSFGDLSKEDWQLLMDKYTK